MSLASDLKAVIADLDKATTDIANVEAALVAKIKNSMTDQEVAEIKAGFQATGDRLRGLGVDPTAPVPPPSVAFASTKTTLGV